MHIPDGFIAPQVYLPAYGVAVVGWSWALRHLRSHLDETTLPRLAVLTALSFVLMMIAIPLPGGTTVHAEGVALLALSFGIPTTFMATSIVLALQALMFGAGGLTALPINALALGLIGATAAVGCRNLVQTWHPKLALFLAGWISIVVPALLLALVLGLQPNIAQASDGSPLFFPFDLSVTLPAIVLPHLLVGLGEGALTLTVMNTLARLKK